VGSTSGNRFEAELPADGVYMVRVYLRRNAARRNETANSTLEVGIAGGSKTAAAAEASPVTVAPFDRTLELQGIRFRVTSAEVADLNVDGSPEIYVYVTSAGSGSHGSLVAYSANRRKSLSEIHLPPVTEDQVASKGYRGHNEFAVVESVLVQRFPVYRDTDTNGKSTGGTRQLQYKLVPGEAGWILRVDRVVEY
jgi:hypothetical protein